MRERERRRGREVEEDRCILVHAVWTEDTYPATFSKRNRYLGII